MQLSFVCVFNCTFLLGCCDIDFVGSSTLLTPRFSVGCVLVNPVVALLKLKET